MIKARICSVPDCSASLGREAVDLYRQVTGESLDEWQAFVLEQGMGLSLHGKWSAFEVAVNGPRQNGKNEIAIARQLAGLFLIKSRLLIHSAHEFKTSTEHQRRLEELIQDAPDLHKRVKARGYKHSHGEESIELRTGQRIRFMTRTKGGGKGHTGDEVYFDEAQILPAAMVGALMPTLSARSVHGNPQLWYFFTAVDQFLQEHGLVAARLRDRALAGGDPSLAYFEWSAHVGDPRKDDPDALTVAMLADRRLWAQATPALGARISEEHIANELRSMGAREFAVERLGVGDYPATDGRGVGNSISVEAWAALVDVRSAALDPVRFAYDVSPDRSRASICVAGRRSDGKMHGEVVEHGRGTGWVPERLAELIGRHRGSTVVGDAAGPAGSLLRPLEELGVTVETVTAREYASACGLLFDLVEQQEVRHLGTSELAVAVGGAATRPLGDAWAWARKSSKVDITPLVAFTLAVWGAAALTGPSVYEERGLLVV